MISVTRPDADQRVLLHGVDRSVDVDRAVVEHVQLDVRHLQVDALDLGPTPSAICTVFVPDCFCTCRRTPGGR